MSRSGSCLCGAVTYEIKTELTETGACHCEMCRKWTGGVFLALQVAPEQLVINGADSIVAYASSPWAERCFCGTCGSSLWYRVTADGSHKGMQYVGFGTLDNQQGISMTGEIYIDKKPEAYSFAGDTYKMTGAEVMADIEGS